MKKILDADRTAELWEAVKSRSIPTKPITSAEYNKLSEEQKQSDTLYVVTDDNYFSGGGSDGVLSFNGRTGDVLPQKGDYTAEDVGALPDTWTPEIDDVQGLEDVLKGKQPSITGNPGQLIGIGDDSVAKATVYPCNPNLLDNSYFVGGGSQQGGGQFPINQLGDASMTGQGYFIDRWYMRSNTYQTMASTLEDDCLHLYRKESGAGITGINQGIENPEKLVGKTLTCSILVKKNTLSTLKFGLYRANSIATHTDAAIAAYIPITNTPTLITCTGIIDSMEGYSNLNFGFAQHQGESIDISIIAAKLELGSVQTLAHQENGQWVLNDPPPDYSLELLKCWRYLQPIIFGGNLDGFDPNYKHIGVNRQLPIVMRANPTMLNPECIYYAARSAAVWKNDYANIEAGGTNATLAGFKLTLPTTFSGNIAECCVFTAAKVNGAYKLGEVGPLWLSAEL